MKNPYEKVENQAKLTKTQINNDIQNLGISKYSEASSIQKQQENLLSLPL
ncbi:hypothetical protein LguiB_027418 [Lonicera macranthoides]